MCFGLDADDTLDILDDKIVAGGLILRRKLLDDRSFGKSHVVFVGRDNLVRILLCGPLDHCEEAAGHFLSVDDEGATENLMAAMLTVDLCEAEYLAIGQGTSQLAFYVVEVFYFLGRECQAFLLVVFLEVLNNLDSRGLDIYGEDLLVEAFVEALEHGVMVSVGTLYGEKLFDSGDAAESHVLCDFYSIGAPGSYHLATWTDEESFERIAFDQCGFTIKPA